MNGLVKGFLCAVLLVGACAGRASATTEELQLTVGTTTVTVTDNVSTPTPNLGLGDLNPATGEIVYLNNDLNGWNIQVVGGASSSPLLTPDGLDLSVQATDVSSTAPLVVFLSDTNFNVPVSSFNLTYSDSDTGGSTTAIAWVDNTNTIFGGQTHANLIGKVGPLTTGGTGGTVTGGLAGVPNYSLTEEETFSATSSPTQYSTDAAITPGPEPASMILFGTGLLGLAVAFFQRKRLGLSNGPLADC